MACATISTLNFCFRPPYARAILCKILIYKLFSFLASSNRMSVLSTLS